MDIGILRPSSQSSQSSQNNLLTISEYEEIVQRLEDSFRLLDMVKDALSSSDNFDQMKQGIEQKCEKVTVRVKIVKKQKQTMSTTNPSLTLHIFKVEITDIEKRGYLMIKNNKSRTLALIDGQNYLLDKVKLIVNKRGEIVLSSTSVTAIREEKEDTFTVESLELSQREHDQSKEIKGMNRDEGSDAENNFAISNFMGGAQNQELVVFQSTKQIITHCEEILSNDPSDESEKKLWNYRELLSWKMPEHYKKNYQAKSLNRPRVGAGNAGDSSLPFNNQINLFILEYITSRLREQRVSFCGIVCHIKQYVDKQNMQKDYEGSNQMNSQIDLESIDDKSRVCVFVRHSPKINLKDTILKDQVVLIKNALRKYSSKNLLVIGQAKDINNFQASASLQLIKTIPSDSIVRHIIKVNTNCQPAETMNEQVCRNGCFIREPFLNIQVLCQIQDGTSKASLELKNDKVKKAFNITDGDIRRFKDYCLKYGTFMHPSTNVNYLYRDIVNVFKKNETWSQMIFYCKAYFKPSNDKKSGAVGAQQGKFGAKSGGNYNDTISKPSFLMKTSQEQEVFLNGEVTTVKDVPGFGGGQLRSVKKPNVCLKCLQVDDNLRSQAVRNVFNNRY
ncbi:UNKNOWN [Stylonychia lemnae]|uniref:Uncharacterized protein n=1 Tax=Stylonychia lemnae TaxID=5949 RepID=A0A078AMW2_STYLE|nr:UNKNOWN [Stylonychia lemnae]|eukprot:CDW83715.1 UNKNOWN [Stylonychia lemnae]